MRPAKGQLKFIPVTIKGKDRDVNLAKIGLTGSIRVRLTGRKGNRILEIERIENKVDTNDTEVHNSP